MPKIKILISKNGREVTAEGLGFKGPLCEEVIKKFTDKYGGETLNDTRKPEWYETPEQTNENLLANEL